MTKRDMAGLVKTIVVFLFLSIYSCCLKIRSIETSTNGTSAEVMAQPNSVIEIASETGNTNGTVVSRSTETAVVSQNILRTK